MLGKVVNPGARARLKWATLIVGRTRFSRIVSGALNLDYLKAKCRTASTSHPLHLCWLPSWRRVSAICETREKSLLGLTRRLLLVDSVRRFRVGPYLKQIVRLKSSCCSEALVYCAKNDYFESTTTSNKRLKRLAFIRAWSLAIQIHPRKNPPSLHGRTTSIAT